MKNENHIQNLKIQNFKSIKEMDLDCGRINLFVGKPNVGKSNILEAMSLLGAYYDFENPFSDKQEFMSDFIRLKDFSNVFLDNNTNLTINVETDKIKAILKEEKRSFKFFLSIGEDDLQFSLGSQGHFSSGNDTANLVSLDKLGPKFYKYNAGFGKKLRSRNISFLLPPFGNNIISILQNHRDLRRDLASFFDAYGLELVINANNNPLEVQKKVDGLVYKIPFGLIADTLQRMIFYLAAVESNKDSVILFEEPEVHAYPPYIRMLAHRIVDSESNQFFITTHSPYLFTTIIENTKEEDLKVFLVDFEDYQTTVQELTSEDITEIKMTGIDIFLNFSFFKDAARV